MTINVQPRDKQSPCSFLYTKMTAASFTGEMLSDHSWAIFALKYLFFF